MTIQELRTAFGPESLTRFTRILEEVMVDLIGDGIPAIVVRSIETRTRLSHMLLGFARSWWTDPQIKQLLLRALRNEISARRYATDSGRVALPETVPTGVACALVSLASINPERLGENPFGRPSRRAEKRSGTKCLRG